MGTTASRNLQVVRRLMGGVGLADATVEDRASAGFERTMAEVFAPDVEVHEPECFPHGGVHHGRDEWFRVRREMLERRARSAWQQKVEVVHLWDVPDDDVVVVNYVMEWTNRSTGRAFRQPAVEVLTFRDGQIVKTEFYPRDSHALLDTLE